MENPKNSEQDVEGEKKSYTLEYIESLEGTLIKKVAFGEYNFYENVYLQILTPRPGTIEADEGYNIRVYDPNFGVKAWCKVEHIHQIEL
jgi:hypothetical protein